MTLTEVLAFLRRHKLAVEATVSSAGAPQSAVVGVAFTESLEVVFDTLTSTRKFQNLVAEPRIALTIGWDTVTVQLEGVADFPTGDELERLKAVYFSVYPDGKERLKWPGLTHVRVRPTWLRWSDFNVEPPRIIEWSEQALREVQRRSSTGQL